MLISAQKMHQSGVNTEGNNRNKTHAYKYNYETSINEWWHNCRECFRQERVLWDSGLMKLWLIKSLLCLCLSEVGRKKKKDT